MTFEFFSLSLYNTKLITGCPFHSLNRSRKYLPKSELLFNRERRQDKKTMKFFNLGVDLSFTENSNASNIF